MKRISLIITLVTLNIFFAISAVIVKKNGENIDGVSINEITSSEINYTVPNGEQQKIAREEVSAILHDDGRYEEIVSSTVKYDNNDNDYSEWQGNESSSSEISLGEGTKEVNVLAYGNYVPMVGYVKDEKHFDATVEYRMIYKGETPKDDWTYLGTTPFAYTTKIGATNEINTPGIRKYAQIRPFVIDNSKNLKKVEFRISKEGYKTVICSPTLMPNIVGHFYYINLNKLKPLKGNSKEELSEYEVEEPTGRRGRRNVETQEETEPKVEYIETRRGRMRMVNGKIVDNNDVEKISKPNFTEKEAVVREETIVSEETVIEGNATFSETPEETELTPVQLEPVQLVPVTVTTTVEPTPQPKNTDRLEVKPLAIDDSRGAGGRMSITVDATGEWELADHPQWCFVTKNANTIVVEVPRNTTTEQRAGNIQIKMRQTDGNYIYKSVRITQSASINYLELSTDYINDPIGKGGKLKVDVATDCSGWQVEGLPSWCWLSEQTSNSFTLILEKNTTGTPRETTFNVKCGTMSQRATISQKAL